MRPVTARLHRVVSALVGSAFVLAGGACGGDVGVGPDGNWLPGTAEHSVQVGSLTRTFVAHVPAHRPTSTSGALRAYPLVIVLHGSNGEGANVEHASRMDSLSERVGYVVAYPNAVRGGGGLYPADWNAGTCCGAAQREQIDDVGFLSAVIAAAENALPIDSRRVYVAGFSSGALMAYHAACRLAPTIAAIGVIEGSLNDDQCAPAQPVPVFAVQGTSDESVHYDDPSLTPPPSPVPPSAAALPPSVQFWVAADGCKTAVATQTAAHVLRTSFTGCTGADVTLFTIDGGQHGWPGEPDGLGAQEPMSELNASAAMLAFFNRHRRP